MYNRICECSDPGCPMHTHSHACNRTGTVILYRVDMPDDGGTLFCDGCGADALTSGLFTDEATADIEAEG